MFQLLLIIARFLTIVVEFFLALVLLLFKILKSFFSVIANILSHAPSFIKLSFLGFFYSYIKSVSLILYAFFSNIFSFIFKSVLLIYSFLIAFGIVSLFWGRKLFHIFIITLIGVFLQSIIFFVSLLFKIVRLIWLPFYIFQTIVLNFSKTFEKMLGILAKNYHKIPKSLKFIIKRYYLISIRFFNLVKVLVYNFVKWIYYKILAVFNSRSVQVLVRGLTFMIVNFKHLPYKIYYFTKKILKDVVGVFVGVFYNIFYVS